jgi:hypothetical protein
MNFNKWRNYLTEAKEATELSGPVDMDNGKIISNKTPKKFERDGRVKHKDKGEGTIVDPDVRGDFVLVKFDNDNEERMVPYGELVLSTDDEDKKDDKGKGENDEMMLDEMCGALPPEEPAVMMPKMTRKVVPHDDEGRMAKSQLYKIAKYAMEMMENLHDDDELEGWVQAKITKAASYMSAAKHYLEYEYKHPPEPDMPMAHKVTPMDDVMPMMESTQKKVDEIIDRVIDSKKNVFLTTEAFKYHTQNNIPITENVFRVGSESYVRLFKEAKQHWKQGKYNPTEEEKLVFETDLGEWGTYNGRRVPLDCPLINETALNEAEYKGKKVKLGKPSRGGSKKFYVYVKCGAKGRVRKISFGDRNLSVKVSDPERRRSFVARHKCKQKNDRCKAGYWACRIGRYPNLTGAKQRYTWW